MLPAAQRVREADDFTRIVRGGRRCGGRFVVVHLLADSSTEESRAGCVVSRAVGNAVTRNLVKRRLRHLLRDRLVALPAGAQVVVRALPAAAGAAYPELGADLDRCLQRAGRR